MGNNGRNSSIFPQSREDVEEMMAESIVDTQGVDWAGLLGGDGSRQLGVTARSLKNTDMQFM